MRLPKLAGSNEFYFYAPTIRLTCINNSKFEKTALHLSLQFKDRIRCHGSKIELAAE